MCHSDINDMTAVHTCLGMYLRHKADIVFDLDVFRHIARENNVYDPSRNYRIFQFTLGTSETIQGFNLGFRQMKSGSKGILIIPSPWGYRDSGTIPGVPANSVLMFEVEFLGMD